MLPPSGSQWLPLLSKDMVPPQLEEIEHLNMEFANEDLLHHFNEDPLSQLLWMLNFQVLLLLQQSS